MEISYRAIGQKLGHHPTTVGREIRRNTDPQEYVALFAQTQAQNLRKGVSRIAKVLTPELKALVIQLLQQDFSPVPIRGRLKKTGEGSGSHETLYRLIGTDKKQGSPLYTPMSQQGKPYLKRGAKNAGRVCIPGRGDIEERPKAAEEKARIGDWEVDLVIGTQSTSPVLWTLFDRAPMVTIIRKFKNKTAKGAAKARILALKGWPVHTIPSDNGQEFSKHAWRKPSSKSPILLF